MLSETKIIFSVEEAPEGGYAVHALGYPTFTEAGTLDELREMVRDAVRCHFEDSQYRRLRLISHCR